MTLTEHPLTLYGNWFDPDTRTIMTLFALANIESEINLTVIDKFDASHHEAN